MIDAPLTKTQPSTRPPIDLNDPIYSRLTAAAPQLLCVADRSGSVTSVSPAFIAYVGVPDASGLLGQSWMEAVHADCRAACSRAWQKSFEAAAAFSFEVRVRCGADGTYRWWLLHGAPEANGDAEPTQWVCVFTSIEAQKQAARKARNDEDRLQTILQRTPMLAFRTDMQSRITMADGKGLKTLQRTKEELEGTPLLQYTAAVPEMDAAVRRCLTNEKVDLEISLRGVDWQLYLAPEVNAEGQQTGMIGLAIDITQRNHAARLAVSEKAARESGQVKAQFLANMSHEVRTPLAGVLGVAELLHDLPLTPEQVRYVEMIQASGQGLLHVINDILSLSQSQSARGPRPLTSFSPAVMLRNQVEMMRSLAQRRGLHLNLVCAADVPSRVLGDVGRIAQVLLNLLSNAIKFTHVGSVELGCHMTDAGALRFYVQDSGIGLDAQAKSRLFLPYSQGDHKVAGHYGGTGLGLSICRDLVKQMGGDIGVESTLGESATFWFTLHLQAQPEAPGQTTPPAVGGAAQLKQSGTSPAGAGVSTAGRAPRVLIVEDNKVNQIMLSAQLAKHGIVYSIANHGGEALEMLRTQDFDLILMDCQMPVMDGYAATEAIRQQERLAGGRIPIVAVTANVLDADQARCRAAGMDDYLGKPFSRDALQATLLRWLPDLNRS